MRTGRTGQDQVGAKGPQLKQALFTAWKMRRKNGSGGGGGGGGSAGRSWAASSGPWGYITRGQCLVPLSGRSSRTHNGTACCGVRSVSTACLKCGLCVAALQEQGRSVSAACRSAAATNTERKPGRGKKIPFS